MKLLGRANETHVIASISHYDYVSASGMMADGGQPTTMNYAGYNRFGGEGKTVWFEVPQDYADLYNDYVFNSSSSDAARKYGIWKKEDVKFLLKEEWPDIEDENLLFENACWGTRGPSGRDKLRYVLLKNCSKDHLEAILSTQSVSQKMAEAINYWLEKAIKDFYYYQYSDDGGKTWRDGDGGLTLLKCVDRSRKCPYKTRILDGDGVVVAKSAINKQIKKLELLKTI